MKNQLLPVKRRPVSKGVFRRMNAVTRKRKQRVAAAAPTADMDSEEGSSKISRALTIIFLIHIVAIGLIFVHQKFLDGRPAETVEKTPSYALDAEQAVVAAPKRTDRPRLSSGEEPYIVRSGGNYQRIAAAEGVDEGDMRAINSHVDIEQGLIMRIPPKRIVAVDPPELAAVRDQTPSDRDRGLVEAVDVNGAPKAQLIRPAVSSAAPVAAQSSGRSYVVKPGDSVWRIANKYKVDQDTLMKINGISNPRKMKTGMKLVIP